MKCLLINSDTPNGGPVHWIHENYACPNCAANPSDPCCQSVPSGQFCKADSFNSTSDPDINHGCEQYRFIVGLDEMALSCELGLYLNFEVTPDGIPYGCPGLKTFNATYWPMGYGYTWSRMPNRPVPHGDWDWHKADPNCGLNTLQEPQGSTPLHQIFEEYASNQTAFISDFVPVLEKMLMNGYTSAELTDAPTPFTDLVCPRGNGNDKDRFTNCYRTSTIQSKPFQIHTH